MTDEPKIPDDDILRPMPGGPDVWIFSRSAAWFDTRDILSPQELEWYGTALLRKMER